MKELSWRMRDLLLDLCTEVEQRPKGFVCEHLTPGNVLFMPTFSPGCFFCEDCLVDDFEDYMGGYATLPSCFRCDPSRGPSPMVKVEMVIAWPEVPYVCVVVPLCEDCRHAEGMTCICPPEAEEDFDA